MTIQKKMIANLERVEVLEFTAESERKDFERSLAVKVLRLWGVGRSVVRKQLGDERFRHLNSRHGHSEVSRRHAWILIEDPKITLRLPKTSTGSAELCIEGTTRWGDYEPWLVPVSILSKSDRDFAKEVRKYQREATERYNKRELEMAMEVVDRETKRKAREDRKQYFANLSKVK